MKKLSLSEDIALKALSAQFGISPAIIYKMIAFESSWNPSAKNPKSSARGLFQWIDTTASRLGYANSAALVNANPTIESQLRLAKKYLQLSGPYSSDYDFVICNFLPAYRKYSPMTKIDSLPNGARIAKANPSIKVLNDYYRKVMAIKSPYDGEHGAALLPVLFGVAAVAMIFFSQILKNIF